MTATSPASTRFVLQADAPLLANLARLWATHPALAVAIENVEPCENYHVEPARSGDPTLAITEADGRRAYLHSRHQPADEARRSVASLSMKDELLFFVHGFGLGYQSDDLLERVGDEAAILIFEPDLNVLQSAFASRDLSRLLSSKRVHFIWDEDKQVIHDRLTPYGALMSLGSVIVRHSPSIQRRPSYFDHVSQCCDAFASYAKTSLNTLLINGQRTAENIARNIGWYAASGGVGALKDAYKGKPALIVSAGPSLRKNRHLIASMQQQAVIVAVQTTLKPLVELGVEPHFVTSLDYHDICTRFFENLPPTLRTHLIAEPKATDRIFAMHPGPVSLNGNDFAEGLLREMKLNHPRLPAGATVAHLAFYLTEHLGCDPVIFVGQDLGFSDGLCYTPGTSYDDVWQPEYSRFCMPEMKQWEQIARDRPILRRIPDQQGRAMYTEERLFTYLQQFERDFAATQRTVIDATEGGALKRGTRIMSLAEAIDTFCRTPIHPQPALPTTTSGALNWSRLADCCASLAARRAEARSIATIAERTADLLQTLSAHLHDGGQANRTIALIDVERVRMNELGQTYDLVMQLSQPTELRRFHADVKLSASKAEGIDKQRRQIARDIANVQGVCEAARAFDLLMDQVIDRLRGQQAERQVAE